MTSREHDYTYAKPSLTIEEQAATGPVRIEMYGEGSLESVNAGRKVLGSLRQIYGISQMQALSQPTGFRHLRRTLPDGTVIHATHNEGHEVISIIAPGKVPKEEKKKDKKWDMGQYNYLWVGIRNTYSPPAPYYGLASILAEPEFDPRDRDTPYYRGYVASSFQAYGYNLAFEYQGSDEDGYTFTGRRRSGGWDMSETGSVEEILQELYDAWYGPQHGNRHILGHHHLFLDIYQGDDWMPWDALTGSFNGLLCSDATMSEATGQGLHKLYPYDPLQSPEWNLGEGRDVSGRDDGFFGNDVMTFGWDIVYWLDPFAAQRTPPCDTRPLSQAFVRYMQSEDGANMWPRGLAQVIPGVYKLGLMAYDTQAVQTSSRQGEEIPTFTSEEVGIPVGRSPSCDYANYLSTPNQPSPKYEVEIRIGKSYMLDDGTFISLGTRRFFFNDWHEDAIGGAVSPELYDDRYSTTTIFGIDNYDECTKEGGQNPSGPNFAPWIDIDMLAGTVTNGGTPPTPGIGGGGTYTRVTGDTRRPVGIYIFGGVFPQPSDGSGPGEWEVLAGTALFEGMEAMTSGVYGCSEMTEVTLAGCIAAFSGTSHQNIYRWNANGGGLEQVPMISSPGDYDYSGPLSEHFYWYYPYFVQHYLACQNGMGILVTSVGPYYEGSQNPTDLADPIDCC